MLFSSSRFSTHEGEAYHRNGGTGQDILEILSIERKKEQVEEAPKNHPAQQRIETQQGCPLKVQGW
jgi:hypothetical protein